MSILHSHEEFNRLKKKIEELAAKVLKYEQQISEMLQDVKRLNYREHHWQPGWRLPVTIINEHGQKVRRTFAEDTYRASIDKHIDADGF
jgi:hypothetical protein